MYHKRKNITFYEKNVKLAKNNINNVFSNKICPIAFYQILKIDEIILGKIFSTTLLFPISKLKFLVAEILEIILEKETFFKNYNI